MPDSTLAQPSTDSDDEDSPVLWRRRMNLIITTGPTLTKLGTTSPQSPINSEGEHPPFLRVAVEIRHIIYSYVDIATPGFMAEIKGDGTVTFTCPALAYVNKQIQAEYIRHSKSRRWLIESQVDNVRFDILHAALQDKQNGLLPTTNSDLYININPPYTPQSGNTQVSLRQIAQSLNSKFPVSMRVRWPAFMTWYLPHLDYSPWEWRGWVASLIEHDHLNHMSDEEYEIVAELLKVLIRALND